MFGAGALGQPRGMVRGGRKEGGSGWEYGQEPETDDMNEVEAAPSPDEKHVWVTPRVIKPKKPKKDSPVNYMSEWGSALLAASGGGSFLWGGRSRGTSELRGLQVDKQRGSGWGV